MVKKNDLKGLFKFLDKIGLTPIKLTRIKEFIIVLEKNI